MLLTKNGIFVYLIDKKINKKERKKNQVRSKVIISSIILAKMCNVIDLHY